ncbi:hypothetical protein ACFIOY_18725 [Bradyrhizobium sp. TZ2]
MLVEANFAGIGATDDNYRKAGAPPSQARHSIIEILNDDPAFRNRPRMSQVVVDVDTLYIAGVVAKNTAGESVIKQTQEILRLSTATSPRRSATVSGMGSI